VVGPHSVRETTLQSVRHRDLVVPVVQILSVEPAVAVVAVVVLVDLEG
jgi:hypothetical protein